MGLWMTAFSARPPGTGDLLYAFRLVFGSAMLTSLVLGIAAIRRGDVAGHRAWMARGYAIGMGAGTQALTLMAWGMIVGPSSEFSVALMHLSGWAINLAIAEWAIRRRPAIRANTALTVAAQTWG
jgi:hypothetical protein